MTRFPTRRALLGASVGMSAALLAGCTITTSGGTTTATLDVTKFSAYATGALNAASILLGITAISSVLGASGVAAVGVVTAALRADLAAFQAAAGSSVSVSLDTASVKTGVDTVLADMESLLSKFGGLLTGTAATVAAQAQTTIQALQAVVEFAEAMLPTASVKLSAPPMSSSDALAALGVH